MQELNYNTPDPIMVAKRYHDEYIALICALFSYGNAKLIVKFLDSLDFSLLNSSEKNIKKELEGFYYRFQKTNDIIDFFITVKRIKDIDSIESLFYEGYKKNHDILDGLFHLISALRKVNNSNTHGYNFLIANPPIKTSKSTYKRYNMYLRWMVRSSSLDMGLWKKVDKSDLLMPLDTHTFNVSRRLGLLQRKTYDLKAVIELTKKLKEFDPKDPIKYDFALYRLGQEKIK